MYVANRTQLFPFGSRVAADMNVVLNYAEIMAEIAAANDQMREVMNRFKRLAHRRQSVSTFNKMSF